MNSASAAAVCSLWRYTSVICLYLCFPNTVLLALCLKLAYYKLSGGDDDDETEINDKRQETDGMRLNKLNKL